MKDINKKISATFQVMDTFEKEDSRFLHVKIWLMHLGQNYNGSVFSKESVTRAIPSLANTPILAYIERNSEDEKDFSDHRTEVHVEDGEFKEKYVGEAIGVIPETNNAQFEMRVGDDGVQREYLTVQGLMWTKWDDPIEIMRKMNTVGQSMELHDEYSGKFDDSGVFHFEDFKFFGACALGIDTQPAMESATIEIDFSVPALQKTIQDKLEEFSLNFNKEEVIFVENTDVNQATEEIVNTEMETDTVEIEETEELKVETKLSEETEEVVETEEETTETEETEEPELDNSADVTEANEEETVEEIEEVETEMETEEVEDEKVVALENELTSLKEAHSALESEVLELRAFKRTTEENALRAQFDGKLPEEDLNNVFESMKEANLEDIEKELFAVIGRLNFEKPKATAKKNDTIKVSLPQNDVEASYYGNFFNRK